jgi:hypothetical protein
MDFSAGRPHAADDAGARTAGPRVRPRRSAAVPHRRRPLRSRRDAETVDGPAEEPRRCPPARRPAVTGRLGQEDPAAARGRPSVTCVNTPPLAQGAPS